MVYYYTSENVKIIRKLLLDYTSEKDVSPCEFMKTYIGKYDLDSTGDTKLAWIAETFLGIKKHEEFIQEVTVHACEELTVDDRINFVIIFHGILFQIDPKDLNSLYKCLFNLSKPLLTAFTKFLGNNEILEWIAQVAQCTYDASYITEHILTPLCLWQPYICEMDQSYAEYKRKIERRKIKRPTIPIEPKVLSRKKVAASMSEHLSPPSPPANSVQGKKKMLSKSAIDQKLKTKHLENQQKAASLLNDVKSSNPHYALIKSDKYYETINVIEKQMDSFGKYPQKTKRNQLKQTDISVKDTAKNVQRMKKHIQEEENKQLQWLENIMNNFGNNTLYETLEEKDRQERERQRLIEIEKKHLLGQISYEEAILAKKKLQQENKKKYEEFLKEKESWDDEIEKWKIFETEKNRKQIEKLSLIELNLLKAKKDLATKKKETVEKLKKESELLRAEALKERSDELQQKINMIKEIKILALVAKKARVPKVIDLTETSGLGLLCEMSMAELQERLSAMKIGINEELERKRSTINEENMTAKQELEKTKNSIKVYMNEKATLKKENTKCSVSLVTNESKELNNLKKMLLEKRKLRQQMSC